MKIILLITCAISVCGLLGEMFYRIITKAKLKVNLLLMLPIYALYGAIMALLYMIPVFKQFLLLPVFMILGGMVSTLIELPFGLLYNKLLKMNVWGYLEEYITLFGKKIPISFFGQIRLKHSILYILLTPIAAYLDEFIRMLAR